MRPAAPTTGARAAYVADQLIVKFRPGLDEAAQEGVKASLGLKTERKHWLTGSELLRVKRGDRLEDVLAKLRADPNVFYAEPDYIVWPSATVNDPDFGYLWGLHNTGQVIRGATGIPDIDVDAPEAWDLTRGFPEIVVAVIDTGVDTSHPDLAANVWANPGEIPGDGIDNDGNGFIDDVNGWDFYHGDATVFDAADGDEHGTHVSGTIAAVVDNGTGIAGVAPNVRILPVKFLGPLGGTTSDAIEAIQYATAMGADIASNSWGGGGYSQALKDAITAFSGPFVAAAGNNGSNTDTSAHYPSSYDCPNIISVAAVNNRGDRASFSNYGPTTVDLGAPGVDVYSLAPGAGYQYMSGTSMATPHVSGVAALMLSLKPSLLTGQLTELLYETVMPLPSLAGMTVTGGMANAYGAATAVAQAGPFLIGTDPVDGATRWPSTRPSWFSSTRTSSGVTASMPSA